jgi:threonine synthase
MTTATLRCRICERTQPLAALSVCPVCDGPLDVDYDLATAQLVPANGVVPRSMWRYRDLLPHESPDSGTPGMTPLVHASRLSDALGIELLLKLEDANPTHSFKDRLAASAVAAAQAFGLETLCCASTGNLGEAVAARCATAGLEAVILCSSEDVALAPAASFGARIFGVAGTLEDCRGLERQLEPLFPWGFLGGNLHAIASEGAKTIAYEIVEQLDARMPDAVVAPIASGTLFAKLAQGFDEVSALGVVDSARPRLYGAQPGGCPPLAAAWADDRPLSKVLPQTEARSLAIGDPIFGDLAMGAARMSGGAIHRVAEEEIGERTAFLAEMTGVLADSAGGVALGALLELVRTGAVAEGERVVLVVTGSGLKPYPPDVEIVSTEVESNVESLLAALGLE